MTIIGNAIRLDPRPDRGNRYPMQTLTSIHSALSQLWELPPTAIENRIKRYSALLRAASGSDIRSGVPIPATVETVAVITLDWLDGAPLENLGRRLPTLWDARYTQKAGSVCPVTGALILGQALIRVIDWDEVTKRLDRFELERETMTASLVWCGKQRPSVFHPYPTPQDWKRAVTEARRRQVHTATLGREGFEGIAALLAKHRNP